VTVEQRPALYELLPAVHRVRDATEGFPLRGLVQAIDELAEALEADTDRLYDNWFIETCDEWVVPYLGDLLAVRGLLPVEGAGFSQRGLVANTVALRRAKGTAAMLEQLARDVTGWPAKAIEYFELLATTRAMNHERRSDVAVVDVRDAARAELTGTLFGRAAHTADARHIDVGRGRHNIPNVGIHLWRLQAYGLTEVTAHAVEPGARYTFDPLGGDVPLFNVPRAERALTELAAELSVPGRLRRRPLHDELEQRRQAAAEERAAAAAVGAPGAPEEVAEQRYFDDRQPVLALTLVSQAHAGAPVLRDEVPPDRLLICNLSDYAGGWRRPPDDKTYRTSAGTDVTVPIAAAVDPELGRLALPSPAPSQLVGVEVRYAYGFPGDVGGGPYDRRESVSAVLAGLPPDPALRHQWGVTQDPEVTGPGIVRTLRDAVAAWNALPAGRFGVIAVMDSRTYEGDLAGAHAVEVKAGSRLLILAAGWPVDQAARALARVRRPGRVTPERRRPHLLGRLEVRGSAGTNPAARGGELTIDGLLLDGAVSVAPGDLGVLRLSHSTAVPARGGLEVRADAAGGDNRRLRVLLERSICGPLRVDPRAHSVRVAQSIVDADGGVALAVPALEANGATVLGTTDTSSIQASDSIFAGRVEVERRQQGCVRYSYLPIDSIVPRRFRCQPENEAAADAVAPAFTSTAYGEPAYCQLARRCPAEIAAGGEHDGEMGAYGFMQQPRRLANLDAQLDEYLRFGLEAGVFFVT
jgi:hypothetical protein